MGKLGKKARKFAKKNLQSVLKRKRKLKSMFKKKSSRGEQDAAGDQLQDETNLLNGRNLEGEDIEGTSLDSIFSEDDSDVAGDDSGSDGFLSEDSSCMYVPESENGNLLEDNGGGSALLVQNREIHLELAKKKKKLDRLKEKDPEFSKFLESYHKGLEELRNDENYSDEDEESDLNMQSMNEDSLNLKIAKLLTNSAIDSWCKIVGDQHSISALPSLLNGYRAACHYGTSSTSALDAAASSYSIQNSETFCNILMFMLREADNIFRGLLGISCSSCRKETILDLKNTAKWKSLKPMVKSYLRSTLFLLNQVTDSEILAFSLTRLRASIIFFTTFPSLLRRLIKIAVHLWATGGGTVSSCTFLIIQDVALIFSSDCFDTCLIKTYKAFIAHSKFVKPGFYKHIQFLRNSFVELCSLDVEKSSKKALVSMQQLAKILQQGLRTRKKEAIEKICSWQYTNCIDLWVMFISANISDNSLQHLLFMIIQIINGVAYLFPAPRYLPLRLKTIQWLNHLSSSSGVFIPVASLVLDTLEYKIGKESGQPGKAFNMSSAIKLPKHCLKSRKFQEECILSAIELLTVHFGQWSYHISFPELASIPLIRLRKFHEITIENLRHVVKRLIDQVEQNVEFVQKKRDEVAFSPNDQQSVESFLQLEKGGGGNAPFTQYYNSIMEKAASRSLLMNEKFPGSEKTREMGKVHDKGERLEVN